MRGALRATRVRAAIEIAQSAIMMGILFCGMALQVHLSAKSIASPSWKLVYPNERVHCLIVYHHSVVSSEWRDIST